MSRIGNMPVVLGDGVEAVIQDDSVTLKNAKDSINVPFPPSIVLKQKDGKLLVYSEAKTKQDRALWGMVRSRLAALVDGLTKGVSITMNIVGVGYRASVKGKDLVLQLGFSHDVVFPVPVGITVACPKPTQVIISGWDKHKVGQVAADIRRFRKPEPYKGKGIHYEGEYILRKEGKKK